MRSPRRLCLGTRCQALTRVLPDRFQHSKAWLAVDSLLLAQQALVDARRYASEDIVRSLGAAMASTASSVQPPGKTANWRKSDCSCRLSNS
jgi:hypothetical protein